MSTDDKMGRMAGKLMGLGLVAEGDIELLGALCEQLERYNVTHVRLGDSLELHLGPKRRAEAPAEQLPAPSSEQDLYAASGIVPVDLRKLRESS